MKILYSQTTKEAVADGSLVSVSQEISKEAGSKTPVYLCRAVFERYIADPEELKG